MPPTPYELGEESCFSHPFARAPEKSYTAPAVGFVLSGCFDYRTQTGATTAVPGTVVFGNLGQQFTCHHEDTFGNRRLVVVFNKAFLEDVANDCGIEDAGFHSAALAPGRAATAIYGRMRKLASMDNQEEAAFIFAASALEAGRSGHEPLRLSGRSRDRVLSVVRFLEDAFDRPHTLKSMAAMACLSRHHFLRLFKQVTGQSPSQYLISTRLRAAADLLLTTRMPISDVAYASGFRDISHFNGCFKTVFGCAPRRWRQL
jgi:AraC family transcriptional regulator